VDCRFTDDPKLSPTGKVFLGGGPIVNLAESDNVLFDRCRFDLVGEACCRGAGRRSIATARCVSARKHPR
jgi:hypothetical protein